MKKHLKKLLSLCLALCLCCCLGATAFAAEINTSGGSGSTPVNLTTTNDGIGGEVTPTKLSVILPTVLPVAMADDGTVVTASDCKIINRSYGAVRVAAVTISAASGWHLTKFGDKSTLAGEKVDANKLGFALSIGGGKQVATAADSAVQTLISTPIPGCYLTGVGDPRRQRGTDQLLRHYHAPVRRPSQAWCSWWSGIRRLDRNDRLGGTRYGTEKKIHYLLLAAGAGDVLLGSKYPGAGSGR